MPAIENAYCQPKAPKAKTTSPKECAVSHAEFVRNAAEQSITMPGGASLRIKPYEYSTGSFGWLGTGKVVLKLANRQEVPCQFDGKLFVVNSKNADRTAPAEESTETVG